jgi:hypothetical protein
MTLDWIRYGIALAGFAGTWWTFVIVAANSSRDILGDGGDDAQDQGVICLQGLRP